MSMEIERKYLLKKNPAELLNDNIITAQSEHRIEQTYYAMDVDQELRVRRIQDVQTGQYSYTHTFKNGIGLAREEVEYEITQVIYDQIMQSFGYIPLTKNRITAKWNETIVEIDIYDQVDFVVLEVEFDSMDEANEFQPPAWFGEEISFNKAYSNKAVWKNLQHKR